MMPGARPACPTSEARRCCGPWLARIPYCLSMPRSSCAGVMSKLMARISMVRSPGSFLPCSQAGPIFANGAGKPLSLGSVVNRVILPTLNRYEVCKKSESDHQKANHAFKRDGFIPEWHGWHAARRGLGSNLYRLGVPDMVIQRILRHANVSTTATYYIKTAEDDVRTAMSKLENQISESEKKLQDTNRTLNCTISGHPASIQ